MTQGVLKNHPWITICRPAVCILTVFGALVGALLVTIPRGDAVDWINLVIALVGALAVSISTMVTNDVADREMDAIEKADRPIPAGQITVRQAQIVGYSGYGLALVCGFLVNIDLGLIFTGIVVASIHYNYLGKRQPVIGNVEVAACVAGIPIFGAASQGRAMDIWFIFAFIFVFEIGRELVVTAQDIKSDKELGLKTLPVYIGQEMSLNVAYCFYAASMAFAVPIFWSGVAGVGWIYTLGSIALVASLFFTAMKVDAEGHTFEAYETWIRTRGRFFILLYQFVLLIEVFW